MDRCFRDLHPDVRLNRAICLQRRRARHIVNLLRGAGGLCTWSCPVPCGCKNGGPMRPCDGARDQRPLPSRSCVEDPGGDGLDAAAACQARTRTRPGKGEALDEPTMAGSKKNARRQKAWIFFQDESGVSQRPSIRRTWAPKGETPVLIHAFNWSKISIDQRPLPSRSCVEDPALQTNRPV